MFCCLGASVVDLDDVRLRLKGFAVRWVGAAWYRLLPAIDWKRTPSECRVCCPEIPRTLDISGDGRLSFDEFVYVETSWSPVDRYASGAWRQPEGRALKIRIRNSDFSRPKTLELWPDFAALMGWCRRKDPFPYDRYARAGCHQLSPAIRQLRLQIDRVQERVMALGHPHIGMAEPPGHGFDALAL